MSDAAEPASQQKHTRLGAGGTAIEDEDDRDRSYARTDIPAVALHALAPKIISSATYPQKRDPASPVAWHGGRTAPRPHAQVQSAITASLSNLLRTI